MSADRGSTKSDIAGPPRRLRGWRSGHGPATTATSDKRLYAPERFDVNFIDSGGREFQEPLIQCWNQSFEAALPIRSLASYRGKKSFSGLWWLATTSAHVGYQSWLERDHVMALDFDAAVVALASRPIRLIWQHDGETRTHTPDYFVRLGDGTAVVIDVRPDDRIEPEDAEAFDITAQACEAVGWTFRRVGEMDGVLRENLRWLSGYRHPRCLHPARAADLRRVFAGGAPLMEGARRAGDSIAVLPTLFHLLWRQVLRTDLAAAPLSAGSVVRTGGEEA
ncbi:TnsA-like heteromeric transposase endonuclease subunit [Micromonospora sp. NPDC005173]|uniref:TnsA-like heteromeric transposase endonuclease subunit n=1 Tax=Micromonospora sp. NPDC005173 TaxID=3157165 RepID=UPI0033AAAF28